MKIVKAQKKIARLKGEIKTLKIRIQSCVSTIKGNSFDENYDELMKKLYLKTEEMIEFKVKVMKVNVENGMFEKIVRLGEAKSMIEFTKSLDVRTGIIPKEYGEGFTEYLSQLSLDHKNQRIEELQTEIESMTEELDDFNAIQSI